MPHALPSPGSKLALQAAELSAALGDDAPDSKTHTERALPNFERIVNKVEDFPEGYPMFAAYLSSDPLFSIYRRFGYLHARVLLDLQYDLSALERELRAKDTKDSLSEHKRLISRKRDDVEASKETSRDVDVRTRRQIMQEIREKLVEYDEMLAKARQVATFQSPTTGNYNSFVNWFMNWKPLIHKEWYPIQHERDMLTFHQGRKWGKFDTVVTWILRKVDCTLVRSIFQPYPLSDKTNDKHLFYYDAGRVETLTVVIITTGLFFLFLLPAVLLYRLSYIGDQQSTFNAAGVVAAFTLFFSAAMSAVAKAKLHELFAGTAVYFGVLLLFISRN